MKEKIEAARKLLNVNAQTSLDDIKKIYKQKALELHPDKSRASTANEQFLLLKNAYELLKENQRSPINNLNTNINEDKNYSARTSNFFNQSKKYKREGPSIKQFDSWHANYSRNHFFIYHPNIKGFKDHITFWNFNGDYPTLSLPINHDKNLYLKIKQSLVPLLPLLKYWPCDNDVEIALRFPKIDNLPEQVLQKVASIYGFPEELVAFIKNQFGLESSKLAATLV